MNTAILESTEGPAATRWFANDPARAAEWAVRNAEWGPVRAAAEERWAAFCAETERRVRGTEGDDEAQRLRTAIFGGCRRCGSERLQVTTRQLRRADEGATELHTCRQCGYTRRINS